MGNTRKIQKNSSRYSKTPVKEILYDLEVLIDRLIDECGWQWGDLFYWLWGHLNIHRKDAQEETAEGETPVFKYEFEEE